MARYANDTLCHVWASGKLASGQSHNGQLYFEGRVLYSYGRHFAVGVLMPDNVVMLNSSKASVTTARHCTYAARATSHMARHYIPELEDIASALEAVAIGQVDDWQESAIARHARKYALAIDEATLFYLFIHSGMRLNAAQKAAKRAKVQAEREAVKAQAEREAVKAQAALEAARTYAALTIAERQAAIAHLSGQWSPINALKVAASNARKAHKAAKSRGWNGIAASVWQYVRALDAKRHWMERNACNIERRKALRRYITRLHGYIARHDTLGASELQDAINSAEYIAQHGKVPMPAMQAALPAARERLTVMREREAARRFEREREAREAWLNGASGYWRGNDSQGGAMLRAIGVERDESGTITGGTLETSQGANVPLIHAIRVFQIARACREAGRGVEPRARVGFYTVDRIDETGGFNAGCHRINWPEIERIAVLLGLYP